MTTKDFMEKVVKPRLAMCVTLLDSIKDKEYTRNNNKFHNFQKAAEIRNIHIIDAWDGMQNKHLVSFLDMILDVKNGNLPSRKLLGDKITDMINYILLFEGIVYELKQGEAKKDDDFDDDFDDDLDGKAPKPAPCKKIMPTNLQR